MLYFAIMETYALIGRSGTGKSFRAQYVASKYHIHLIIDDGLLIKGDKILAGKSAKHDPNFMAAIKTALFQDEEHYNSVINTLKKERIRKILILGTSEKMVVKIAQRLDLPAPSTIIHIEDIATQDEIDTAMRVRYTEGKHIIPVPSIQVTRSYPSIVYDSIKVAFKKMGNLPFSLFPFKKQYKQSESTLVKPEFSKQPEEAIISDVAISQMISQSLYEYGGNKFKIEKVNYSMKDIGYCLSVVLRTPVIVTLHEQMELKEYITDSLEKYGGIILDYVELKIENWDSKPQQTT